jgi:solute carrier family 25 (mitochondrial carnitine/acylcarnitine transporter), member 20/29
MSTATNSQSSSATITTTNVSYRSVLNSVAAGYCAGITGTVVGHPLDSLKVWMQTESLNNNITTGTTNQQQSQSTSISNTTPLHQNQNQQSSQRQSSVANNTTTGSTTSGSSAKSNSTRVGNAILTSSSSSSSSSSARPLSTLALPLNTIHEGVVTKGNVVQPMRTNAGITSSPTVLLGQIKNLYAGVTGPLLTVGLIQSLNFALYDSFRRLLYNSQQEVSTSTSQGHRANQYLYSDSLWNVGISSMGAGIVLGIITNPILIIKTQQQTSIRNNNGAKLRFITASKQLLFASSSTTGSVNSTALSQRLFRGFVPHMISEVAGRGVYFVVYEYMKRYYVSRQQQQQNGFNNTQFQPPLTCTLTERMISAAIAGMVCWGTIYPLDVIRSRMFVSTTSNNTTTTTTTTRQMIQTMYSNGGYKSFYRGFGITILRAGPVAAFVLPVYDLSFEYISQL